MGGRVGLRWQGLSEKVHRVLHTECRAQECSASRSYGRGDHGHTLRDPCVDPALETAEVVEMEDRLLNSLVLRFTWGQSCFLELLFV